MDSNKIIKRKKLMYKINLKKKEYVYTYVKLIMCFFLPI